MAEPVGVTDVAEYILRKQGEMTTWKLQKLCYYAQAWSLVWDDEPLFESPIEAWANGPVVPELYQWHRGSFKVFLTPNGDPSKLSEDQQQTIDAVLKSYGDMASASLSGLTHQEAPWYEARRREGLLPGERGNAEITLDSMAEYYGGLYNAEET